MNRGRVGWTRPDLYPRASMSGLRAHQGERLAPVGAGEIPQLSVVIVSWNSGEDLVNCIRSLHENPPGVAWEAIVVDNGSTDGSIATIRAQFPQTRLIVNRANRGLAAANNQGIAASRGEFVLISNPDVLYGERALDALLDLMRRRERAAFAVAKLTHPDGVLQTAAGDLPTTREALLGRRMSRRRTADGCSGVWWHGWAHDEERQIGHGAEACYLVRRAAIGEIGVQDERFVLDWEGLDWARRARQAGWELWFCPAARVTHMVAVSTQQVPGRWIYSTHLGMYRYLSTTTPPALRPALALVIAIRGLLKFLALKAGARTYELQRD
jgi:GT2 family glycosyltransferase